MLFHEPMIHASSTRLPWPLSMMQRHDIGMVFSDWTNKRNIRDHVFSKQEIERAIDEFLAGSNPDDDVVMEVISTNKALLTKLQRTIDTLRDMHTPEV